MNILVITNLFPNPVEPERGNFVAAMVDELSLQASVHVISPLPWFPNLRIFQKINKIANWLNYARVPKRSTRNDYQVFFPKYYFFPKFGFALQPALIAMASFGLVRKIVRENKIDIISSHWIYPDAVASVWMARRLKIPCVVSARGCDINLFGESPVRKPQIAWAMKNAAAVTVVSKALADRINQDFAIEWQKITLIPNGVDKKKFCCMNQTQCRVRLGLDKSKKYLLFVGQLHEVKGILTLLDALLLLGARGRLNFSTIIVGDGPLAAEVHAVVAGHKLLEQSVQLQGAVTPALVAEFMGASDLFCLPSIREGRPNVIIEALAVGLPVVASKVGGIPELVGDHNGILIEPGQPELLATALELGFARIWDSRKIAESQEINTWSNCANQYLELFARVIG